MGKSMSGWSWKEVEDILERMIDSNEDPFVVSKEFDILAKSQSASEIAI